MTPLTPLPTNKVSDQLDTSQNTYRIYDILDENGDAVESDIHLSEKTVYTVNGSEVSAQDINEICSRINKLYTENDFTITTSGWVTNTNTRNNSTYTVMQEITAPQYANTSDDANLDCFILSATSGEVMTETEKEESYKLSSDVDKSANGFYVYAEEATTVALRIRVKGV